MVKGRSISVNLQKGLGAVLAAGLALGVAGCGTFTHYPQGMEQTTLAPLRAGQPPDYQKTFHRRTKKKGSGTLFALELGRTAQLAGDFAASRAAFESAFAGIEDLDNRAVVSARGAVAQGGAVLVNDKAIPYRTPSYERTLAHHYQVLNYLALGDLTGAGVEVRRANRVQGEALAKREKEVAKAKSKETNAPADETARDPHLDAVYAGLDQLAGSVKSSFQNAATFYVSAVVWEMLGELNDAYIDVKKALEIAPENHFLQLDAVRLAKRLGMREDLEDYERRFPRAAKMPAAGSEKLADKARLVVVYEEGFVPPKIEMAVPYPLTSTDSIGLVALPTYAAAAAAAPVRVALDGQPLASTAPLCNVGALAARALAEQMPGILTRQLARAVAKGAASKAAHDAGGNAGQLAELAVLLYNVASEQADLRSWLTLPAHVQAFSAFVDPGDRSVALAGPGAGSAWTGPVTLRAGKTTLIHVTRIDLAVYSHVFVQP